MFQKGTTPIKNVLYATYEHIQVVANFDHSIDILYDYTTDIY